jgi:HAD superfamily hydrolase (TIGR01493 family)
MVDDTVRAVLFDFGNTLFAHHSLADTIVVAAARLGHSVEPEWASTLAERITVTAHLPEELQHPRDLDAAVWSARWHVLYGAADDTVPGLGAAIYKAMHEPSSWLPYRDTVATLTRLRGAGVAVGVVSNTGWDIRAVFAHHGVDDLVDAFVLSCEVGAVKPSPAIFLAACTSLGVPPEAALMVGDDPSADVGATRVGMRTLLLPVAPPGADNGIAIVG